MQHEKTEKKMCEVTTLSWMIPTTCDFLYNDDQTPWVRWHSSLLLWVKTISLPNFPPHCPSQPPSGYIDSCSRDFVGEEGSLPGPPKLMWQVGDPPLPCTNTSLAQVLDVVCLYIQCVLSCGLSQQVFYSDILASHPNAPPQQLACRPLTDIVWKASLCMYVFITSSSSSWTIVCSLWEVHIQP